jgi:hypothetical protein
MKSGSNTKIWLLPGEKKTETRYHEGVAEECTYLL